MTAEIAIMNKRAVALAADSVVTIGSGEKRKTFDTVNKLFALSKYQPVGVMVYGNSEYMGYPWETVIKDYRRKLGDDCKSTIKEYAADLFGYLKSEFQFSLQDYRDNVIKLLFDEVSNFSPDDLSDLDRRLDEILSHTIIPEFSNFTYRQFRNEYRREIKSVIKYFLGKNKIPFTKIKKLYKVLYHTITRDVFSSYSSGIVFAGFGEEEFFPTLIQYDIDGMISGILKFKEVEHVDVSRNNTHAMIPFAQKDVVGAFINGIDYKLFERFRGSILASIFKYGKSLLSDYEQDDEKLNELVRGKFDLMSDTYERILEQLKDFQTSEYHEPMSNAIEVLPKEELAELAESFVNMTSVRRRMSSETETVGGPIDVAVISKGDGLVWIKRKHYFDSKINPFFIERYLT